MNEFSSQSCQNWPKPDSFTSLTISYSINYNNIAKAVSSRCKDLYVRTYMRCNVTKLISLEIQHWQPFKGPVLLHGENRALGENVNRTLRLHPVCISDMSIFRPCCIRFASVLRPICVPLACAGVSKAQRTLKLAICHCTAFSGPCAVIQLDGDKVVS